MNQVDVIQQICTIDPTNLQKTPILRSETIYKTMKRMAPTANNIIEKNIFAFFERDFKPIYTGNGICYTFNSLNSREIYSDEYE